jgi:lysozyme
MVINEDGINIITEFEGCRLVAYKCPAGVWTIGYGHTGPDVTEGLQWTQNQADTALLKDLARFNEGVSKLVHSEVNINQFSALVCFAYNCGLSNLKQSTLLKKINANPDDPTIKAEFARWNKAEGKVLYGLAIRRRQESELYFK